MKTPEEIKKGLECYFRSENYLCGAICRGCECDLYTGNYSVAENVKDALTYIQQLEDGIDRIYKLAKDINVPTNQQKWISVKERFPKHKQVVLAYVDPCVEIVQWNEADELWEADAGWFKLDSVTHWMPLPEPPKED